MSGANPEQLWNLIPNGPTPLTGQEQLLAAQTASPSAAMYRYPANAFTDAAVVVASSVIATGTTISRTLQNRFADRYSVLDSLTPGQPDGTTNNTAQLQAAVNAAAGVAQLLFPATANPYITTGLQIPSDMHIIIEAGATIRLANGADALVAGNPVPNCSLLALAITGASNVLIELYGTLDGNVANQALTGFYAGGVFTYAAGTYSNIYVMGGKLGLVTNCRNSGVNIGRCTNGEVNGVTISSCGNSTQFFGFTPQTAVSSGTYDPTSGAAVLTTTTAHGVVPGEKFIFWHPSGTGNFLFLVGEWVAGAGTSGTTINFTATLHMGAMTITGGRVGICDKCYNVGFVDCVDDGIQDLGLVLYGGIVGGYVRGCEVRYCGGPTIFIDDNQPGTNVDCEISGCYCHDNGGGGPGVASNVAGLVSQDSRIFDNRISFNNGGGIGVSGADGAQVSNNLLHDNVPGLFGLPSSTTNYCVSLLVGTSTRVSVDSNTILDPGAAISARKISFITKANSANTYNSGTGNVSLVTVAAHGIPVGGQFFIIVVRGSGAVGEIRGWQTATAGTAGTALNYTTTPGLGTITIFDGQLLYNTPAPAANTIVSGTYDSPSGTVVLTVGSSPGWDVGDTVVISSVVGSGTVGVLNGSQVIAAVTTTPSFTISLVVPAGLAAMTIAGGSIVSANFGIAVYPLDGTALSVSSTDTRITNNVITDRQSPRNLTVPLGGTWGLRGYSGGNTYGTRQVSTIADASIYTPGLNQSTQGLSYDGVNNNMVGSYGAAGSVSYTANGLPSTLSPKGFTPGWNTSGRGEVDFFCGRDSGAEGGFTFWQVDALAVTSASTYTSGSGEVSLATAIPHNLLQGSVFTFSGATGTGADLATLNNTFTADATTTSTTLGFTIATGLTITTITGGTVVPSGKGGGVIDTSVGLAGVLLANDGFGNTRLGGALVHGAVQQSGTTIASGNTLTIAANTSFVEVQNGASFAALTVVMPTPVTGSFPAVGGNVLEVNFQNPVGTLTLTGTITNGPTAIAAAGTSVSFIANSGTSWLRRVMT